MGNPKTILICAVMSAACLHTAAALAAAYPDSTVVVIEDHQPEPPLVAMQFDFTPAVAYPLDTYYLEPSLFGFMKKETSAKVWSTYKKDRRQVLKKKKRAHRAYRRGLQW